jgi:hypothetical protein
MNETPEIQRLTKAITNLATVLVEMTAARVREQQPIPAPPVTQHIPRVTDNLMTKKDVAAYLKVSLERSAPWYGSAVCPISNWAEA